MANEIFVKVAAVRQQSTQAARERGGLGALLPLINDYHVQFQKFVAEADQKASLRSSISVLTQRIDSGIRNSYLDDTWKGPLPKERPNPI